MQVSGLISSKGADVVTAAPGSSVADVAALLSANRIGAVVVSADGTRIDGVLSERDIVWALAARGASAMDERAEAIMTTEVFTCGRDATVEQVMGMMTEHRIRHVPVVAEDQLAGIISIGDVVKHRMSELENETQVLHEYIAHGR